MGDRQRFILLLLDAMMRGVEKDCDTFTKVIVGNVSAEEKKELLECLR